MAPRRSLLTLALICAAVTFSPLPCPAGYRAPDPHLFVPGADPDFHEALRQAKSAAYASIKEPPADKNNAPSFDDVPQPATASSPLALLKAYKGEPLSDRPWLSKEHASYGLGLLGATLGDGLESLAVTLDGERLWYAERGEKELGVWPDHGAGVASSKEEPEVHAAEKPERVMLAYAGPMVGLLGPAAAAGAKAVTEAVVGAGVGTMAGAVLKKTVEKLTTPAHEPSPCETQEGFDQADAAPSTLATPVAEDGPTARESFPAASPAPMGPTETYPADIEAPDTSRLFKGTSEEGRKMNPPKAESPICKELKPYRKDIKTNGLSGNKERYYQWDYTHNDIEVYNGKGVHLGSMDPVSGEIYKDKVEDRDIEDDL